jgi:hypothetical protein
MVQAVDVGCGTGIRYLNRYLSSFFNMIKISM